MGKVVVVLALLLQETEVSRIRVFIERMGSENVQERDEAVRRLEALGASALPALRKAAFHSDPEISSRAAYLIRLNDLRNLLTAKLRRAIPGVENRLAAGGAAGWTDVFLQASSRSRYPFLGSEDLDPLVAKAFRGASSPGQRISLCAYARRHHLRSAIPGMIPLLVDPDRRVREHAAEALFDLKPDGSLADIAKLLGRGSPRADTAAVLLGRLQAVKVLPEIRRLLSDPKASVRVCALTARAAMRQDGAVDDVIPLADDVEPQVRERAVDALASLDAKEAIPVVARLVADEASIVRTAALTGLAALGAVDRADDIASRLEDSLPEVRRAAVEALLHLDARAFAPDVAGRLADGDAGVRQSAVETLVRFKATERIRDLVALLKDPDANVLHAVVWGAGELRAEAASEPLAALLRDPRVEVRINVLMALDRTGVRDVVPEVRRRLADPKILVRATAARLLGRHRAPGVFQDLVRMLGDADALVRSSAAWALGRLGRPDAEPSLEKLLADRGDAESSSRRSLEDVLRQTESWHVRAAIDDLYRVSHPLVRVTAAFALCRLGSGRGIPLILDYADESGVGRECVALNAVRRPGVWKRLQETRLKRPVKGDEASEKISQVAAQAGLRLEEGGRARKILDGEDFDPPEREVSVGRALELMAKEYRMNFIYESDRIRIVSGRDFLDFWIAWHAGRNGDR